ncbi:lipopolysaccharide heptosyltransferase family protein [Photobacterium profundum]|uniref:Putative lipopolysaccharide biosynthesis protein n=1 Tax=Photobacterium profundum 3TCK TaxID=314280 RepID=Q1YWA8_9GAMM|nr:glycosyltransferase family 9 protein [Photobacterium profundum]EAS40579.1 putative lipopolysaccharide biosynthesis protein [Photobacterium profundum 3TCK]PSV61150.1 lipopolysaccharide heptosyltransferase family protein [Photobacterium profundum]
MALFSSPPKSLCILRLSAIGDVCHAIAVVQAIQQHWPETDITWVTGKIETQLIGNLPGIKVVTFDKKAGLKGMLAVWSALKGQKFDALLHMQAAIRASALSLGIKAKYRVGFSRNRTKEGQWLFTNKHLPNTDSFHVLDNFADFARYIGVPFTAPNWNIPLTDEDIQFAKHYTADKKTLLISPAASKDERNWLTERYAEIADHANQQGMQVLLCGSPAPREINLGKSIEQHCQYPVVNLIGQTNLKQLTALLGQADVVLAPDTGPAHLATTQGTPVIGLYAHSNPKRTGPYNSLDIVASVYEQHVEEQQGKPIHDLPWGTRVKGTDLMQDISVEHVKNILAGILSTANQR